MPGERNNLLLSRRHLHDAMARMAIWGQALLL